MLGLNTNLAKLSGKHELNSNVSKVIYSIDYPANQGLVMSIRFVDNFGNQVSLRADQNSMEYSTYYKETDTWVSNWIK